MSELPDFSIQTIVHDDKVGTRRILFLVTFQAHSNDDLVCPVIMSVFNETQM